MRKIYKFIGLVIISALIHELGHIIVGGGISEIKYAPEYDPFSVKITTAHNNPVPDYFVTIAGFLITLPLILVNKWLFPILIIESRWDLIILFTGTY